MPKKLHGAAAKSAAKKAAMPAPRSPAAGPKKQIPAFLAKKLGRKR
jgi:hypothetical protein